MSSRKPAGAKKALLPLLEDNILLRFEFPPDDDTHDDRTMHHFFRVVMKKRISRPVDFRRRKKQPSLRCDETKSELEAGWSESS